MKKDAAAQIMVKSPSRMNIHAHPGFPPIPCIFWIAAASNPENAPDNDEKEKRNATLHT